MSSMRQTVDLSLTQPFSYVLRQILSGAAADVAVEAIHEYLRTVGTNVREGKISFDDFVINKVRSSPTRLSSSK